MINEKNYVIFGASDIESKMMNIASSYQKAAPLLLFIEPYGACLSLLKHAVAHGMSVIIMTANDDLRKIAASILKEALLTIQVETADNAAMIAAANLLRSLFTIDAVIPGFEYFVPVAAAVAAQFSLPSIEENNVFGLRNKYEMRKKLQAKGVLVPEFELIQNLDALERALDGVDFPRILKPIDSAGSVCVSKVNSAEEALSVFAAFNNEPITLWGHTLSSSMLLEEYINGKEYSVEGVVANDRVIHFCITEKILSDEGDFVEIGHIVNPELEIKVQDKIRFYVNDVIKALGANHCPFHAELRLTETGEPVLMEIAARLPGDKIAELINLVSSQSYFDAVLAVYLGMPISEDILLHGAAGIRFFYRPTIACYSQVEGFNHLVEADLVDKSLYYQPDQFIPSFPKALRRMGHVILKSTKSAGLSYRLHQLDKQVNFIEN